MNEPVLLSSKAIVKEDDVYPSLFSESPTVVADTKAAKHAFQTCPSSTVGLNSKHCHSSKTCPNSKNGKNSISDIGSKSYPQCEHRELSRRLRRVKRKLFLKLAAAESQCLMNDREFGRKFTDDVSYTGQMTGCTSDIAT